MVWESKSSPAVNEPSLFGAPRPATQTLRLDIANDFEAEEWRALVAIHERHERDKVIVQAKKQIALKETGKLACEVCAFDFAATYGGLGEGFAECHHRKPVATLCEGETTRFEDLAIVCANCHRMLHRDVFLTVEGLREVIGVRR